MPLNPGTRLGAYEILGALGAGGMGEVYRARDPRLGRHVAIKLLPEAFAADPERLARFEREARLLAALNHPNVAILHGLETDGPHRFLVMELVEGGSLAQRLAAGPLPMAEVVDIGRQVATALEAAHEAGMVHRDLKPGNIMVTPDGVAKVLDFGLAKGPVGSASDMSLSMSPTQTYSATIGGAILGTAAYMSPEQARGKPVDRRTDIWAFGCVLYECLTAQRAFEGETVSDMIAAILKSDVAWDALPADTPPGLRRLLARCLERDPRQRLRDIGEARLILEGSLAAPAQESVGATGARAGVPLPVAVGAALLLAAFAAAGAWWLRPAPEAPTTWSDLVPPPEFRPLMGPGGNMALSPDGQQVAFLASDTVGVRRLLVRDLSTGGVRVVDTQGDPSYPFWSPDGASLGYFREGRLHRIDLEGGAGSALADAPEGRGGAWSRNGDIVFAPSSRGGLSLVRAAGGEVRVLIPDSLAEGWRFPHFLPDGRHLIAARFDSTASRIRLERLSLRDGARRALALGDGIMGNTAFVDGHLFFVQAGALKARRFDPATAEFRGEAQTLASQVVSSHSRGRADFAVGGAGTILYRAGSDGGPDEVVIRDRNGQVVDRMAGTMPLEDLDLSRDGRTVLVAGVNAQRNESSIWRFDLARGTRTRLTFPTSGFCDDPALSADGQRVAFAERASVRTIAATGAGGETVVLRRPWDALVAQWFPDGRSLLFTSPDTLGDRGRRHDMLWRLDLESGEPSALLASPSGAIRQPQLSPDGRWLAYSAQAERFEVFVQDFPALSGRWQVSNRGGAMMRWRGDGREIFYLDYDGAMNAVPIEPRGPGLELGTPQSLFTTELSPSHLSNRGFSFGVNAAGDRFALIEPLRSSDATSPWVLVRGWRPR